MPCKTERNAFRDTWYVRCGATKVERCIVTCGGEVTVFLEAFQKKSEYKEYRDTSSGVAPSRDQPQGVCKVQDLRVDVAWSLIMATVVQGWCKDGFGRMEHRIRDDLPIAFCHAAWRLCGSRAALGL